MKSLDQRLREDLRSAVDRVDTGADGPALRSVVDGGRRRRGIRRARNGTLILAAVVAIVASGPDVLDAIRSDQLRPAAPLIPEGAVVGTYRVDLSTDDPTVIAAAMGGTWLVSLEPDGTLDVTPPARFLEQQGAAPTGNVYAVTGRTFRTNLFDTCVDVVGSYRWTLADGRLTFDRLDDACPERVILLAAVWVRR